MKVNIWCAIKLCGLLTHNVSTVSSVSNTAVADGYVTFILPAIPSTGTKDIVMVMTDKTGQQSGPVSLAVKVASAPYEVIVVATIITTEEPIKLKVTLQVGALEK